MIDSQKILKWVDAINNYYAFAILLYAIVLFAASNSQLFFWIALVSTPILTGWTGYLLKSYLEQRNQRHGFKMVSDSMSYEIGPNHKYTLRYETKLKACASHLMMYPIAYKWTGNGDISTPQVTGENQQLLTLVGSGDKKSSLHKPLPYKNSESTEGDWHYWFIALNPPVHKDQVIKIKYSQKFHDKEGTAKPRLNYFVRIPMESLQLNIKFPDNAPPKKVKSSYIKPSDTSRPYVTPEVHYDPYKNWATWTIEKPKRGYCYRISWE